MERQTFHHLQIRDCDTVVQREMILPVKRRAVLAVLRALDWNQSKAADALGLSEEELSDVIKDSPLQKERWGGEERSLQTQPIPEGQ